MSGGSRGLARILMDVSRERFAQDEQWGVQQRADGTGCNAYRVQAEAAKADTSIAAADGELTWSLVLLEEVYEALAENPNSPLLRNELVQAMAVIAAWIEDIDSREE